MTLGSADSINSPGYVAGNYFRRIPTYVITIHQRYRRTDGRLAIANQ